MVRKVITRSPHREVGTVNAQWLLSHPVHHESHLERRFIMTCLACPCVRDLEHQPEEIELPGDRPKNYTPDFRVTFKDGQQEIVEVKPRKFVAKHQDKLGAAARVYLNRDMKFHVITDQEIDRDGLGLRAIHLMSFARIWISQEHEDSLLKELEENFGGSTQVGKMIAKGYPSYVIWSLVARHKLRVSPGINMTDAEEISLSQTKEDASDLFRSWFDLT